MRRAAKFALGCLFAPVGLFVLGLIAFGALRAAGVPDPEVGSERLTQAVPAPEPPALESVRRPEAPTSPEIAADAVRVELDLVEGYFRVEPHDGSEIEVEAEYDKATYRLEQSYDLEGDTPVFRLVFESKLHWLRRIAQDGSIDDADMAQNEVVVRLPRGVPIDLDVKISRSESELDLSGLSLTNLVTDLGMGEYDVEIAAPNPIVMPRARFDVGMGEVRVRGASNLHAGWIDLAGGMGEITLDMGTSLLVDTRVEARMRMGEMTLLLPDDALLDVDSGFDAILGEVDQRGVKSRVADPETAHTLRVKGSVLMGALIVDEFRARPTFGEPR